MIRCEDVLNLAVASRAVAVAEELCTARTARAVRTVRTVRAISRLARGRELEKRIDKTSVCFLFMRIYMITYFTVASFFLNKPI